MECHPHAMEPRSRQRLRHWRSANLEHHTYLLIGDD